MNLEDFTSTVLPLKNKIFRFAKRLMNIHVEAEDITQDVFIKLWNRKNELEQLNNIEAFAMTVTKNLCLDKLKSQKVVIIALHSEGLPMNDSPHKLAELTDQKSLMNAIIDRLPEQQKTIIHLRDIEGYEFEEIAEITGLNINVIRVNLSRARKAVKEELVKIYNYGLETN